MPESGPGRFEDVTITEKTIIVSHLAIIFNKIGGV
jgi:hypothetical protein